MWLPATSCQPPARTPVTGPDCGWDAGATIIAPMTMSIRSALLLLVTFAAVFASVLPASAQRDTVDCGEYKGVVCQGYFNDDVGVVDDPQRIEDAISRIVVHYGNPIAVVVVQNSQGDDPADFAAGLANEWGVGDPVEENGILILVSLDERRTEVVTQDGVSVPGEAVAGSARSFFSADDFEGGLLAIVGSVEQALAGTLVEESDSGGSPIGAIVFFGIVGFFIYTVVQRATGGKRRARKAEHDEREELIDADLADLEPSGADLPRYADYSEPAPAVVDIPRERASRCFGRLSPAVRRIPMSCAHCGASISSLLSIGRVSLPTPGSLLICGPPMSAPCSRRPFRMLPMRRLRSITMMTGRSSQGGGISIV